ncbi:diphosphomevalonate decarboxylase [Streptobacillus felis]|uniref:diphosphomevalonate decarboxylase n=1 Tax=Streptobacillus felis TaxID=1384509 RepID=A0A7Z0PHK8_9FUSO|nr:diphosphomevalonate decarboxylase [Streptobacillus felis]NYV28150.1 diphosphomevalonate decarboxylase [Streptobacillus felis]
MARGYINIAIVKYWGKKEFNPYLIPTQGSISLKSNRLYTETNISKSDVDKFILNGVVQNESETKKIFEFVDKVVKEREKICIESKNYVPTAAGLASSASAYCALTKELNEYFKLNLSINEMAKISTMGSGSACRSFYNLAAFDKYGEVYELNTDLNLAMLAIVVSDKKKEIPSRDAMKIAQNSVIYPMWVKRANDDFEKMKKALIENDFVKVGNIMEKNTIIMHNTTFRSNPLFSFLNEETYSVIKTIKRIRMRGINVFTTMDAGPNVKVLYLKEDEEKVLEALKEYFEGKILLC